MSLLARAFSTLQLREFRVCRIPLNVTTLWAWDAALTNWYFYAPSLEKSNGLLNYIQSKSYLDFGTKCSTRRWGSG